MARPIVLQLMPLLRTYRHIQTLVGTHSNIIKLTCRSTSNASSVKAALPLKVNPSPQEESEEFSFDRLEALLEEQEADQIKTLAEQDLPISSLPNPYEPPPKKCILCQYLVQVDYKNARLLSQFVSPYTGQIYGRHITGLCIHMQKKVARNIKRARTLGYMAYVNKDPKYLQDPKLYDPLGMLGRK